MLPVLALGMKVYYYIALMVVILKYVVCLGRISLLGKILSFYFLTYSLREKKKKKNIKGGKETSQTTD